MTTFGTRPVDRKPAITFARCGVGRIVNINGTPHIGFLSRELKRRRKRLFDVAALIGDQPTQEICTAGQPTWVQFSRTWYPVEGEPITEADFDADRKMKWEVGRYMLLAVGDLTEASPQIAEIFKRCQRRAGLIAEAIAGTETVDQRSARIAAIGQRVMADAEMQKVFDDPQLRQTLSKYLSKYFGREAVDHILGPAVGAALKQRR
jgi:hypothetical protein